MHVDNQDIARMARELCEEENSQLHVARWGRRRRFAVPAWLTAIPAAAVVGFLLGLWTNSRLSADSPLTAMADTVYIKVKEVVPIVDTVYMTTPTPSAQPAKPAVVKPKAATPARPVATGRSMANDRIRYDLLVKN